MTQQKNKRKQNDNLFKILQNHFGEETTASTSNFATLMAQSASSSSNQSSGTAPASSSNKPIPEPVPMETDNISHKKKVQKKVVHIYLKNEEEK